MITTAMNSSTPMYRLIGFDGLMRKMMMQMIDTMMSSTISRLVNCRRKSSHRGTLGGGVRTLRPSSARTSAALPEESPRLCSGLIVSR